MPRLGLSLFLDISQICGSQHFWGNLRAWTSPWIVGRSHGLADAHGSKPEAWPFPLPRIKETSCCRCYALHVFVDMCYSHIIFLCTFIFMLHLYFYIFLIFIHVICLLFVLEDLRKHTSLVDAATILLRSLCFSARCGMANRRHLGLSMQLNSPHLNAVNLTCSSN